MKLHAPGGDANFLFECWQTWTQVLTKAMDRRPLFMDEVVALLVPKDRFEGKPERHAEFVLIVKEFLTMMAEADNLAIRGVGTARPLIAPVFDRDDDASRNAQAWLERETYRVVRRCGPVEARTVPDLVVPRGVPGRGETKSLVADFVIEYLVADGKIRREGTKLVVGDAEPPAGLTDNDPCPTPDNGRFMRPRVRR
jgi:hypothetical protein